MLPRHLYIHVPFCARRCVYCDFSIAVRRDVPVADYLRGVAAELAMRYGGAFAPLRPVIPAKAGISGGNDDSSLRTVYLGGGTPSRLGTEGISALMSIVRQTARIESDAEITLEANPEDVSPASAAAWVAAGVNRVSLGVQSFHDPSLEWMHRVHGAGQVDVAVAAIRGAGITNLSLDLIFALPTVLGRVWERDVMRALDLAPEHVSVYGLTVEARTPLGRWRARGQVDEAPEERYEEEFLAAHDLLTAAGYGHYEVSSYALEGRVSQHNSAYWSDIPYAGIGPAAHGYDGAVRRWNVAPYSAWQERLDAGLDPRDSDETLTPDNRLNEHVYLSLRTWAGLPLEPGDAPHIQPWLDAGWGSVTGNRLRLTAAGWLRLDALAAALTVVRSRS